MNYNITQICEFNSPEEFIEIIIHHFTKLERNICTITSIKRLIQNSIQVCLFLRTKNDDL